MIPLVRLLAFRTAEYFNEELKSALWPVSGYLRRLGIGVSLVIASAVAWITALFFWLLALFFYFSQIDAFAAPAAWTGLFSLGIGIILTFLGLNLIRRPH